MTPTELDYKIDIFRVKVVTKRNFFPTVFLWHWEDQFQQQYNFFGRIFAPPFVLEIFNFIGYAENTTTDVILYNGVALRLLIL